MTVPEPVRRLLPAGLLLALICASGALAIRATPAGHPVASWWPGAGLGTVLLLLYDRDRMARLTIAAGVAFTVANLLGGRSPVVSVGFGVVDAVEVALAAWIVRRCMSDTGLSGRRDLICLAAAAAAGAVVASAAVGLWVMVTGTGDGDYAAALAMPSHAASILVLAPVALTRRQRAGRLARWPEIVFHVVLLGAVTSWVFRPGAHLPMAFVPLPLLVWAAARFGPRIVSWELLWFALLTTSMAYDDGRFFAGEAIGRSTPASLDEVYVLCVLATILPLTIAFGERDRALTSLRRSDGLFRSTFAESTVPMLMLGARDSGLPVLDANEAALALFDESRESLQGRPFPSIATTAEPVEDAAQAIEAGRSRGWSGTVRVIRRPEVRAAMALSPTHLTDSDVHHTAQLVDLTAAHRDRTQLRAEKDFTQALLDITGNLVIVTDLVGTVLHVNRAMTEVTGWPAEHLEGRLIWERLSTRSRLTNSEREFHYLRDHPGGAARLLDLPTAGGGQRYVMMCSGRVLDGDGQPTHLVLVGADVTAERDASDLMAHLLHAATRTALIGTDLTGRITIFNAGAESLLGYDAAEATQRNVEEFFAAGEIVEHAELTGVEPGFRSLIALVEQSGSAETRDWTWRTSDSADVRVSLTSQRVTNPFGRPTGYLFVAHDVTADRVSQELLVRTLDRERQAADRLRELDRAKNVFISTVSHELRTPMSSIVGYAEMLQDGLVGGLNPEQLRVVDAMARNGARLSGLADDLLVLSSFDAGITSLHDDEIDLREVVRSSTAQESDLLASRRLDLNLEIPPVPVVVRGDAKHLTRALSHLLSNAVKFTPDGGTITVRISTGGGQAMIRVDDTGIGIPSAQIDRVFERFFRSTNAEDEATQGSGLGLSIVESIVAAHQGSVDVSSVEGNGTSFVIRLPQAAA